MDKPSRYDIKLRWILVLITIIYIGHYLSLDATPGNYPYDHPQGWWGWFDQGEYLKSAYAIFQGDLSPNKYFYPPLYPALGALFLNWSTGHPYFLPNLAFLLWVSYVFIRVSDRYLPRWGGTLLFFASVILNVSVFENYVIPWTTSLSAALISTGILGLLWIQNIFDDIDVKISPWRIFVVSLCLGLILPTRPVDAVSISSIFCIAMLGGYITLIKRSSEKIPSFPVSFTAATLGLAFGFLIYFGFNKLVFGDFLGGYLTSTTERHSFPIADYLEKFVSIWLDGKTLYGEPGAGLTQKYPWLLIAIAGLIWALLKGDFILRTLSISIITLFAIYLPFGDLLPNGLWRFKNIHYFKWTFPYLALIAWLLFQNVLTTWRKRTGWILPTSLLVFIPLLLLSLHFEINNQSLKITSYAENVFEFSMPANEIDFIDFNGVNGGFQEIYFSNNHLLLDGYELKQVRDFRLLPMGAYTRVLFIRPIKGKTIELTLDPRLERRYSSLAGQAGSYHFVFGTPNLFRHYFQRDIFSDYLLGDIINFSSQGRGQFYIGEGWSGSEDWGTWSVNKESKINMHLLNSNRTPLTLELTYGVMLNDKLPCQRVKISANDYPISNENICMSTYGTTPTLHRYTLPAEIVLDDGVLTIKLNTPDASSPQSLGINNDPRVIGLGLRNLQVNE